jgi:hypothetical protein
VMAQEKSEYEWRDSKKMHAYYFRNINQKVQF